MRRAVTTGLLIAGSLLLQILLGQILPQTVARPNLILCLVVSTGFICGRKLGILTGFFGGLAVDLLYSDLVGLSALLLMFVGYFNGFAYQFFFDEDSKVPLVLTGISNIGFQLFYYLILYMMGRPLHPGSLLEDFILPETVMTMLFCLVLYRLYFLINRRLTIYEIEEQQSPWLRK